MKKGAFFFIHFSRQLIFVSKLSFTKVLYINYKSQFLLLLLLHRESGVTPVSGHRVALFPLFLSFLFQSELNYQKECRRVIPGWLCCWLCLCSCRALKVYDSLLGFKKCHLFLSAFLCFTRQFSSVLLCRMSGNIANAAQCCCCCTKWQPGLPFDMANVTEHS